MKTKEVKPEDLVIIGLDTDDGPDHPLYDERVKLPLKIPFVRNVDRYGVMQAPEVIESENKLLVADGRQRVRAAREVNNRRAKPPKTAPLTVTVHIVDASGELAKERGVSANVNRQELEPIQKARECANHAEAGLTKTELADMFGVTTKQVGNWLDVMTFATPETLEAIETGLKDDEGNLITRTIMVDGEEVERPVLLTLSDAISLVRTPKPGGKRGQYIAVVPEEQVVAVRRYIRAKARRRIKGESSGSSASSKPGRKDLDAMAAAMVGIDGWQYHPKVVEARQLLRRVFPSNDFAAGILFCLGTLDLDMLGMSDDEAAAFKLIRQAAFRPQTRTKVRQLLAEEEQKVKDAAKAEEEAKAKAEKKNKKPSAPGKGETPAQRKAREKRESK